MKSKFLLKLLLPIVLFLTGNVLIAQTINLTPVVGTMNSVYSATPTSATLTVSASGLTGATETVTISTPVGYEISTDNVSFASSVNINAVANAIGPAVLLYVRIIALSNVGTYAGGNISASSASAATQTQATGSNSITPKPITIAAPTIAPKVYNASTTAGTITLGAITGLVGVETLTVTATGTAYSSANVGAYTSDVSYAIANGTGLAANYSALATSLAVPGSITAKPITISAPTIAPKVYDATTAAGVITQGTVSGLVGVETLTVTSSATAYSSANVGAAYTSTVSYVIADGTGSVSYTHLTLPTIA